MKYLVFTISLLFFQFSNAQSINSYGTSSPTISGESAFLDASSFSGIQSSRAKGLAFPRTNLSTFTFASDGSPFANFTTFYDGMVVYNTVTGTTPAAGAGVRSGVGSQAVTPGFYYFSNPTNATVVGGAGRWIRMDGNENIVKTKEIIKTIAANETTTTVNLALGDGGAAGSGMTGITVNEFIGAKIYKNNAAKDLQMNATSGFDKDSKVLTTGNGFISQVLPAGTYRFVIEYK